VSKRLVISSCLLCFAAGWLLSDIQPHTQDRPVLRAMVKFAKTALWFAAFAEPAPDNIEQHKSVMVDETGYVRVNHARGW
jgi:hypothetical protein